MICLLCPVLCLLAKNTPLSSACCNSALQSLHTTTADIYSVAAVRTAMSCAKSYCYVRGGHWAVPVLLPCQILAAGLGWAGCWLRNVWRCDDTCELLGWAGLGWAGLQQLPSQHRDNTPDLGITRAALAGSRPRPALDFLPTYSVFTLCKFSSFETLHC